MKKWTSLILLFFCLSCQSKPVQNVTAIPDFVEVRAQVTSSPRPNHEIESPILLNKGIQNCLRDALNSDQKSFSLILKGVLSHRGALEEGRAVTPNKDLRRCLAGPMNSVNFGEGPSGQLELHILIGPSLGQMKIKGKGLRLDLKSIKKLEKGRLTP